MNDQEKLQYLKQYQEWRRGSDAIPAPDPTVLGHVLDYAVACCERCAQLDSTAEHRISEEGVRYTPQHGGSSGQVLTEKYWPEINAILRFLGYTEDDDVQINDWTHLYEFAGRYPDSNHDAVDGEQPLDARFRWKQWVENNWAGSFPNVPLATSNNELYLVDIAQRIRESHPVKSATHTPAF